MVARNLIETFQEVQLPSRQDYLGMGHAELVKTECRLYFAWIKGLIDDATYHTHKAMLVRVNHWRDAEDAAVAAKAAVYALLFPYPTLVGED
jgi:hypothetical protein